MRRLNCACLLEQSELIPAVPCLDDLASAHSYNHDAWNGNAIPGTADAQAIAGMGSLEEDADHHLVAVCDGVLDTDVHIGKRRSKIAPECLEVIGSAHFSAYLSKPISDRVLGEHFIDRGFSTLVPHFFEPPVNKSFCLSHCNCLLKPQLFYQGFCGREMAFE